METLKTPTQCLLFVTHECVQNSQNFFKSKSFMGGQKPQSFVLLPTFISQSCPKISQCFTRCGVQILTSQESTALISALQNNQVEVVELILVKGQILKRQHVFVEAGNVEIVSNILGKSFLVSKTKLSSFMVVCGAVDAMNSGILKSLLTVKADISHRNPRGGTLLHLAVCRKSVVLFKTLLKHGACANSHRKDGSTPLHLAAQKGNVGFIKLLLEQGASEDARRNDSSTCLILAAGMKHERAFELLLRSGATIPTETHEYVRLLHLAVKSFSDDLVLKLLCSESCSILSASEKCDLCNELLPEAVKKRRNGVVKQLLEYGANANMLVCDGRSILHLAVCKENPEMVENLLKFNPDATSEPQNKEALREAVLGNGENFEKITKMLLQHGLKFDAKDIKDMKLLCSAIKKNYLKVVEQLIGSGLDVSAEDESFEKFGEDTLLMVAVKCGNPDIIELLLCKGADPNLKSWFSTPLLEAVKKRSVSAVKTLLEHGAENCPDVLNTAVRGGSGEIVELLLQHGANPNAYNEKGVERTVPIVTAANEVNVKLIDMLLRYGADINGCDRNGTTALHAACDGGYAPYTIVEYLIRNNADLDRKDCKGFTPLGYAAGRDRFEVVDMLLKSGARYNFRNVYGNTPANYDAFLAFLNHGFTDDELLKNIGHLTKVPAWNDYMWNYRFRKFSMRLARHLVKMEAAGLFYVELKAMSEWTCNEITSKDFLTKCEAEVASMKARIINNTKVSFYDILICGPRRLMCYARNDNIEKLLNDGDFIKEFPIYASIINCQLRKGVFQRDLVVEGAKTFHFVFKKSPKLPDNLVEKILGYLRNQDIIVLMNAVSPMDISVQSER